MFVLQNELDDKAKDCSLGVLIMKNVWNTRSDKLNSMKLELENGIRGNFGNAARKELEAFHPMDTYVSYYKRFGYTYHVLPQLESMIQGKSIPGGLPLVEAMFMAELKNMLLTAGHDFEKIRVPLCLKAPAGNESYTALSGKDVATISGDIMLADQEAVISSILRGPDLRTAITAQTRQAIYTVYAPSGIQNEMICQHLSDIEAYIRVFSEEASTSLKQVYGG
ncbi:hypothetical protein UF75_3312 [Desulfosporosinus sp. I2]|uniref:hypothetical protein n=1 Tax=Desulfosporosinus sp. I2 TaxID=1617025 RepID=UPI0005EE77A8|nr:hypothetical protein [Desulfosporosinus sp. I2]KJR46281.1 hypothetical protein UF75_3312 [Desulfosporosinus sp. I2]